MYRVEMILSPKETNSVGGALGGLGGQLGGLAALAGLSPLRGQDKYEAIATLRAPAFISGFIQENQLLPKLYPRQFEKTDAKASSKRVPTLNDAVRLFSQEIMSVKDDPKTGMVSLRVEWRNPETAAAWSSALVKRANDIIRLRDIREAEHSIEYLKRELERTNQVGIREAINNVIEEHLKVITLASVRPEYAFKVIDPGVVPDIDKPVRPRKMLMLLAGLILGGILGVLFACFRDGLFQSRDATIN
jgi:hypothetical protein